MPKFEVRYTQLNRYLRIIDAPDLAEAKKIFADAGYDGDSAQADYGDDLINTDIDCVDVCSAASNP